MYLIKYDNIVLTHLSSTFYITHLINVINYTAHLLN